MQSKDDKNENNPTSPSQLSPLQIPKHEPFSPQFPLPHQVPIQPPQNSTQGNPSSSSSSSSSSQNSTNASHSAIPSPSPPPTTTMMSNSVSSSPNFPPCGPPSPAQMSSSSTSAPKFPPCGPPSPAQMSSSISPLIFPPCGPPSPAQVSSPSTRIPWPLMPPPQQPPPLSHQSSTMSYYQPMGVPPPLAHQSSTMSYYQPMGVPPPFPYFSMPHPHDQFHSFHYPMIPGNNNNNDVSNGQIYSQPWSTGLFDCFSDLKNCFITCLCPCVTFGQVDEILSEGQMTWWEGALMFGILDTLCISQASFIFAWYHRVQFRKKYNLMGNLLSEFAITLCCMRLVLCQNYRQLNKLGLDVALGWKANQKKQRRISSQASVQFVPPMANPGMFR